MAAVSRLLDELRWQHMEYWRPSLLAIALHCVCGKGASFKYAAAGNMHASKVHAALALHICVIGHQEAERQLVRPCCDVMICFAMFSATD